MSVTSGSSGGVPSLETTNNVQPVISDHSSAGGHPDSTITQSPIASAPSETYLSPSESEFSCTTEDSTNYSSHEGQTPENYTVNEPSQSVESKEAGIRGEATTPETTIQKEDAHTYREGPPIRNDDRTTSNEPQTQSYFSKVIEEVLLGDAYSGDPTVAGTAAKALIDKTPAGIAADARDTAIAANRIANDPSSIDAWVEFGWAGVGWVPFVGDIAKAGRKAAKNTAKVVKNSKAEDASQAFQSIVKRLDDTDQVIRSTNNGETETSFRGLIDNKSYSEDPNIKERLSTAHKFDIGGYHSLTSKGEFGRSNDNLDSDEAIQNLFWRKEHGVERENELIKDNPAMALPPAIHKKIKNLKDDLSSRSIRGRSAEEVLSHHISEMKRTGDIPDYAIVILEREGKKYIEQKKAEQQSQKNKKQTRKRRKK